MKTGGGAWRVLTGFSPWIIFGIVTGPGRVPLAAGAALLSALILNAYRWRRRSLKSLEVVTLLYFLAHTLCTSVWGSTLFLRYGAIFSGGTLAAVAWGSLLAGSPFTYEYAREDWAPEYWDDPSFRRINRVITAVWGILFTLRALGAAGAILANVGAAGRTGLLIVLPYGGIALGLVFSAWFPMASVRATLRRELKAMDPYPWPAPSFPRPPDAEGQDVIVIGAGIGGLTAAALLARHGRRVLVIEQHRVPGGFCTSWERKVRRDGQPWRYVFDAGVHDISGLGERGPVRNLLRRLDREQELDWRPVCHEYRIGDMRLRIPPGPESFPQALTALFPEERAGIEAFFEQMRHLFRELYAGVEASGGVPAPPSSMEEMLAYAETCPHLFRWQDRPFGDLVDHYLRAARLKALVAMLTGYVSDHPAEVTVGAMAPIFGYYIDGGYYPAGGSQAFADMLVRAIEARGGRVRLRTPVAGVRIENGRAVGVRLASGEECRAEAVVSNADVQRTCLEWVGRNNLPDDYVRKIASLPLSASAFLVTLGIDRVPDIEPVTMTEEVGLFVPSRVDPALAPPGHASLEIMHLVPRDEAAAWDRAAPSYAARKQAFGDRLIDAAERVIPDLRRHIVYRQDASPQTFARYTGASDGAIYGFAVAAPRPPIKTPVERLYLAGAGTQPGSGVEAVVISGTRVADAIDGDS